MGLVCTTCSRKFTNENDTESRNEAEQESNKFLYEFLERKRNKFKDYKNKLRKQTKPNAILESATIYWLNRRHMTLREEHRPVVTYKIKNIKNLVKKKNLIVTLEVLSLLKNLFLWFVLGMQCCEKD